MKTWEDTVLNQAERWAAIEEALKADPNTADCTLTRDSILVRKQAEVTWKALRSLFRAELMEEK